MGTLRNMINIVGIDNIKIILIKNALCNNKQELLKIEREEFDKHFGNENFVNKQRPISYEGEKEELKK
jgi:hypothetical protein